MPGLHVRTPVKDFQCQKPSTHEHCFYLVLHEIGDSLARVEGLPERQVARNLLLLQGKGKTPSEWPVLECGKSMRRGKGKKN